MWRRRRERWRRRGRLPAVGIDARGVGHHVIVCSGVGHSQRVGHHDSRHLLRHDGQSDGQRLEGRGCSGEHAGDADGLAGQHDISCAGLRGAQRRNQVFCRRGIHDVRRFWRRRRGRADGGTRGTASRQRPRPERGVGCIVQQLLYLRLAPCRGKVSEHDDVADGQRALGDGHQHECSQQCGVHQPRGDEGDEGWGGDGLRVRCPGVVQAWQCELQCRRQHVGARRHLEQGHAEVVHVSEHQWRQLVFEHHHADVRQD